MFSERLRELRKSRKLTQIEFAKQFSVSNGTVAMWETKKRVPDAGTLQKLAEYFDVTVDYLLGLSEDRKNPVPEDEVDKEILERFANLTPAQQEKVAAFIEGLLAAKE